MITIRLPLPLRRYARGQPQVRISGRTVSECIALLEAEYPELREHLRDEEDGSISAAVNLYVNGEDVRHLRGMDTSLTDDDELTIVVAIAGGCEPPVSGVEFQVSGAGPLRERRRLAGPRSAETRNPKLETRMGVDAWDEM